MARRERSALALFIASAFIAIVLQGCAGLDAEGRPVRAGAEGVVLRDTPFIAQTVDAERVFDAAELQRVLSSSHRDELPGAPLKLEVAFDNLVAQLTRGTVQVPAR